MVEADRNRIDRSKAHGTPFTSVRLPDVKSKLYANHKYHVCKNLSAIGKVNLYLAHLVSCPDGGDEDDDGDISGVID